MDYEKLKPFADISSHHKANSIIRERSVNKVDIRDFAFDGLDIGNAERVLDLGCGFGFMAEKYIRTVSPAARVTGIDICEENRTPFLSIIGDAGRSGMFMGYEITSKLPFDDAAFDLIISSYSLYFFPRIIAEVARVLTGDGCFIVITHSEDSFTGLYRTVGLSIADSVHRELLMQFSAENGYEKLRTHFSDIMRMDYENRLEFREEHAGELLDYAAFKLPLLLSRIDMSRGLPAQYRNTILENLKRHGIVVIEKNDSVFQCRGPRCR